MPFRQPTFGSPVYEEEPQDIPAGEEFQQQLQNVVHNKAPGVAPHNPYRQAVASQYNNQPYQNYIDPTRAVASPPPQGYYPSGTVSVDESEFRELHRRASDHTGHKFGKTIIKGRAIVHQGNIYDNPAPGQEPPKHMKQHEYGDTEIEESETGSPRVQKGDSSAQALHHMGFWRDRAPQQRTHSGSYYPTYPGR